MVRRNPRREMDRGSAQRTTKRPQEMWLSPHERARLPCQTGGAILDGSAPSKRGSDLMFGACDRRAETTPEPVPLPDIAPSSAPPEVQRIPPTNREDPWTRGAHPAAPIHPTQTMRREPHTARVMSPQIPPPLATKPRTPRRLVSPCPRHIPREDDERRERARRDRASGAERVIGRELPSRVDEHSLNVSLHTTGRAIDR